MKKVLFISSTGGHLSEMLQLKDMFNRYDRTYERNQQCLIGHPVYVEFLKNVYDIGNTVYKEIAGKKNMFVILPDTMSEEKLREMKKPIYRYNR